MASKVINVTKTFLPPFPEYQRYLEQIWKDNQIANGGKLWTELQVELKKFLKSPDLILTANGTLPLQISLKALAEKGEVITTPFSYVATAAAIVWQNCTPVFVDIDPDYLTIDERKIEAAITAKTTAILATHVFGNPCNVEEIEKIAEKHDLKVIYDAAHCFGVRYKGESIFNFGNVSTCSFHATKIFHTGEGGAMFCKEEDVYHELFYSHNFGHKDELNFHGLGINAKMSELQAAMGLAVLPYVEKNIQKRKKLVELYAENLTNLDVQFQQLREETEWNYSYLPIIFEDEKELEIVQNSLSSRGIFGRRYFYPSLNTLKYMESSKMANSESISKRIFCLPIYQDLDSAIVIETCQILKTALSKGKSEF